MSNIIPIEHNNQRVLTTQQLADGYETDAQIIRNNFNRNRDRYTPGIHYYLLEGAEFQAFKATNQIDLPLNINSQYKLNVSLDREGCTSPRQVTEYRPSMGGLPRTC